mgnify:CR=1 FL=1
MFFVGKNELMMVAAKFGGIYRTPLFPPPISTKTIRYEATKRVSSKHLVIISISQHNGSVTQH